MQTSLGCDSSCAHTRSRALALAPCEHPAGEGHQLLDALLDLVAPHLLPALALDAAQLQVPLGVLLLEHDAVSRAERLGEVPRDERWSEGDRVGREGVEGLGGPVGGNGGGGGRAG